jgi:hypothetical protein
MNEKDKEHNWNLESFLFKDVESELEDDVTLGQRGFNRNVDRLCA